MSRNTVPKHGEVLKRLSLLHLKNRFHPTALWEHQINKGERREMWSSHYSSIKASWECIDVKLGKRLCPISSSLTVSLQLHQLLFEHIVLSSQHKEACEVGHCTETEIRQWGCLHLWFLVKKKKSGFINFMDENDNDGIHVTICSTDN